MLDQSACHNLDTPRENSAIRPATASLVAASLAVLPTVFGLAIMFFLCSSKATLCSNISSLVVHNVVLYLLVSFMPPNVCAKRCFRPRMGTLQGVSHTVQRYQSLSKMPVFPVTTLTQPLAHIECIPGVIIPFPKCLFLLSHCAVLIPLQHVYCHGSSGYRGPFSPPRCLTLS